VIGLIVARFDWSVFDREFVAIDAKQRQQGKNSQRSWQS